MIPQITTLTNGIRVVTHRMPHIDSVSVGVFVRTGSRNESEDINGISHFLEHMAFKGTETRSGKEIAIAVERLGAMMNAYTSKDTTAYYMVGLSKHTATFVELLSDMLQHNSFPEDEIERERGVIIQEFNQYQDDADSIANNLYDHVAYLNHPMGRSIVGPKRNIQRFTRADFKRYMDVHYHASNLIIGVAGNIDHDETVRLVEQWFGDVPESSSSSLYTKVPNYFGGIKSKKKAAFTQSTVMLGWPIETLRGDHYADVVASTLLGDGFSSPLFEEIREKRGLAYHVASYHHLMDTVGQSYIHANTTAEHLDEFFNATCDVLKTVATTVNPIDLERAINTLTVSEVRKQERGFGILASAAEDIFTYGSIIEPRETIQRIESVTHVDVQQSFERMLKKMPTITVVGKGADDRFLQIVQDKLK